MSECNCRVRVDAQLHDHACALEAGIVILPSGDLSGRYVVATKRTDGKRKPPMKVFATFCPFCGKAAK
jgi:hypothetical protein